MAGGACMVGGVCVAGGHAWQRGGACVAGDTATAVGGTHPTGMHSCLSLLFRFNLTNKLKKKERSKQCL